jgi:pseudaminic acid cytidylyltransferase
MSVVAIIPARGGSKRLPRKNILPFMGEPMLSHPLRAALDSGVFSRVIVSTEDEEISGIARKYGAEISSRPPEFATDTAHELDACLYAIDELVAAGEKEPEAFCVIYATAVFLKPEDFQASVKLLDGPPQADSVMGVSGYNYHPYKAMTRGDDGYLQMMYPVECMWRSQLYPHVVASNGTLYWLRTETLRAGREKEYFQDRLVPYEIPFERAVDMDTLDDLRQAEMMARLRLESVAG